MEKEILEILFAVKDKRISVGNALEKIKEIQKQELTEILQEINKQSREVTYPPIRFDGIHKTMVGAIFQKRGVEVNFF